MLFKLSDKNKGFTLVELLAVIVILAIILAIAVPMITGIVRKATINAFEQDAKMVLKAIDFKVIKEDAFDISELNVDTMASLLDVSNNNYERIIVTEEENNKHYIYIEGKNKWADLVACGTYSNITVETKDNIDVCQVPEGNGPGGWTCGDPFLDERIDDNNPNPQSYGTVEIGDQCWLAEDLKWKCSNYSGAAEPSGWGSSSNMCAPSGQDGNNNDYSATVLYQWGAVADACPNGWHFPTNEEWDTLIGSLENNWGDRLKDKGIAGWCSNNSETWCGSSKFLAQPAGYRRPSSGSLFLVGEKTYWWQECSGPYDLNILVLDNYSAGCAFNAVSLDDSLEGVFGCSIRCIAD